MNGLTNPYGSGWVARFKDECALQEAVQVMMSSGLSDWDAVAPYPCRAVRLISSGVFSPRRRLSAFGVSGGILGGSIVAVWIALTQMPLPSIVVQGRPWGWVAWPGIVPPIFEGILLGAGLGLVIGFLKDCRLPNWHHWVFEDNAIDEDGFFIVVSSTCGERGKAVLEELSSLSIQIVEIEKKGDEE